MAAETTWSELKQSGNDLFKNAHFLKAAAKYTAAIKIFDGESEELAVLHRCVLNFCRLHTVHVANTSMR